MVKTEEVFKNRCLPLPTILNHPTKTLDDNLGNGSSSSSFFLPKFSLFP